MTTKSFLDSLNISLDSIVSFQEQQLHFTGVSLVNAKQIKSLEQVKETYLILDDKRLVFNLNTKQDCELLGIS